MKNTLGLQKLQCAFVPARRMMRRAGMRAAWPFAELSPPRQFGSDAPALPAFWTSSHMRIVQDAAFLAAQLPDPAGRPGSGWPFRTVSTPRRLPVRPPPLTRSPPRHSRGVRPRGRIAGSVDLDPVGGTPEKRSGRTVSTTGWPTIRDVQAPFHRAVFTPSPLSAPHRWHR